MSSILTNSKLFWFSDVANQKLDESFVIFATSHFLTVDVNRLPVIKTFCLN